MGLPITESTPRGDTAGRGAAAAATWVSRFTQPRTPLLRALCHGTGPPLSEQPEPHGVAVSAGTAGTRRASLWPAGSITSQPSANWGVLFWGDFFPLLCFYCSTRRSAQHVLSPVTGFWPHWSLSLLCGSRRETKDRPWGKQSHLSGQAGQWDPKPPRSLARLPGAPESPTPGHEASGRGRPSGAASEVCRAPDGRAQGTGSGPGSSLRGKRGQAAPQPLWKARLAQRQVG